MYKVKALSLIIFVTVSCIYTTVYSKDLTEKELESFFRKNTISGNHVAAIKIRFSLPKPGVAYLGTIHGYPDNLSVCEGLIAPYNADPSLTTIPGSIYFCEVLR